MKTAVTSTAAAPAATETYATAYARLTAIAERLKSSGTTSDLESVVRDLRDARAAHNFCKSRLDAIRR